MSSRRKYQGTIFIFFVLYASRLSSSTFSPQVFQNLIIPKGVFSVKVNVDWLQCINNCVNSAECISYNFKTGNTRSLCELSRCALPANGECSKSLLRYSHGFVHQQLKISPRKWEECDITVHPTTPPPTPAPYKDCSDAFNRGQTTNKVYSISPDGAGVFPVQCDQSTAGGGWIIIQQRIDGSQDFYQPWDKYASGFGRLDIDYWLGLDKIHRLTFAGNTDLRIEMKTDNVANNAYALYENFTVSSKETLYKLNAVYINGVGASDSLTTSHVGYPFSTKDKDNDGCANCSCSQKNKSAWWYDGSNNRCSTSDLNAPYYKSISWLTYGYDIRKTYMKIRPH